MIKFTTCFPMVGGCPGTLGSPTTKTGRHDIAEILLISQVGQLEL